MPFRISYIIIAILFVLFCSSGCSFSESGEWTYVAKGRTVEIVGTPGNYKLYRQGKPYFIKGAAGRTE